VRFLRHWLPQLFSPLGRHPDQTVLVLICDEVAGLPLDWGPEVEDLIQRLSRLTSSMRRESFVDVEYVDKQYRLRFESADANALAKTFAKALSRSVMASVTEVYWRRSGEEVLHRVGM
jgi:hypothetical protein